MLYDELVFPQGLSLDMAQAHLDSQAREAFELFDEKKSGIAMVAQIVCLLGFFFIFA